MKLYYAPGACSLSPHIALSESGLPFEAVRVSTKTHTLDDGSDFYAINPLGYVPLLVLDTGEHLHEGPAIVQYIADQVPERALASRNGSFARYKLQEWLNFISTELHKAFSPLFNPNASDDAKAAAKQQLGARLAWVDSQLNGADYLLGAQFSVADAYLFTVTNWAKPVGLDLSKLPHLIAWRARVGKRPAVIAAMTAEGLLKTA
ncbi:glutathione transferase GstA [Rhodocyclus gracilis]|uniref:Glutathione transferase GstA n=1 Tax=Rhodocyclus tenuis TaxID=1066 RepID=A0A6L5JTE7_RHOTE|nr:glutathione transferase GstA [Rhodocyclus gracilis]MQY50499.1 glutathione transferase GstA [Rhodocyclus gracilis]